LNTWRAALRAPFDAWWLRRHPKQDQVLLTHRTVYILPSRAGWLLGVTLLLLLVSAINYQLSLGYALTFLLSGCVLVAMPISHATLRGLRLHLQAPPPVFATQDALILVHLHNPRAATRFAVELRWQHSVQAACLNVPGRSFAQTQLRLPCPQRGQQALPPLVISTRFPLGCFRVWFVWRAASQVLVYPAIEQRPPPLPLPATQPGPGAHSTTNGVQAQDLLRPYRAGDPLKTIAWKKVAQTGDLISREGELSRPAALELSLQDTGLAEREHQLSRLCAWLLQAEAQGLRYGLRLPGQHLQADHGSQHLTRCLRALALS
jgi:uncharacterized protein (DUF58 family)